MVSYTYDNVVIWNVGAREAVYSLSLGRILSMPSNEARYYMSLSPSGRYLVLTADAPKVEWERLSEKQLQNTCAVVKITNKKGTSHFTK